MIHIRAKIYGKIGALIIQGDVAGKAEDGHSLSAMGMAIYKAMSVLGLK